MTPHSGRRLALREWVWWPKTALGWMGLAALGIGIGYWIYWANVGAPRSAFLSFVPTGEMGAPHPVRWMVERCAGDGGYFDTGITPGVLTASSVPHQSDVFAVRWTIHRATYAFVLNLNPSSSTLRPANTLATACVTSEGW